MATDLQLNVPNLWQHVREVRRQVADALQALPEEVREAAEMTAAELVENAVKYGDSVPACPDVRLNMRVADEVISIEVANGVRSSSGTFRELLGRLEAISKSEDPERLYMERLQALMIDSHASGKLGLYRIGFEGRFSLSHEFDSGREVLKVKATRRMEQRLP
ncbi:MAG: hypothetical protein WBV82_22905 [Myxococcaceae bacterium]